LLFNTSWLLQRTAILKCSGPRLVPVLPVVHESEAMCPYCGTRYRLKSATGVHSE